MKPPPCGHLSAKIFRKPFIICHLFLEEASSTRLIANHLRILGLFLFLWHEQLKLEYGFTLIVFVYIFFTDNVLEVVLALDKEMLVGCLTLSDVIGETLARHNVIGVVGTPDRHLYIFIKFKRRSHSPYSGGE